MTWPFDIRQLYKPVQPTVGASGEDVSYREIPPAKELEQVIYCYWQLKTHHVLPEPFLYRVVADGCIDVFFELEAPEQSFIMGFCKQYTEFPLDPQFNYVGIRFLPTMFPQFFRVDASGLSNRFQELSAVVPELAEFIAKEIRSVNSLVDIGNAIDTYLLGKLLNVDFTQDGRLYDAINIILSRNGVLDIEKDLDVGISPRQLRRLFEYYIGDTAKTFSKVVRFQYVLNANHRLDSLRKNKLFYDAGYYDQAHFIKEFRKFYGVTPSRAFGK
jgi:hypothetical protein